MKPILEVNGLSKKYIITHQSGGYLSLRERLLGVVRFNKDKAEDFWALTNISFNVQAGESLGIIGRNGAGKSTLLKILSRITPPTHGSVITRGRIASLLEVGTGFHPELTGRENIYLNGSLLGMKRREIDQKFDEIVDFSGMEKFLDTPLKHYSSGMQLRLAFSVAAFLEPEILIIDEVLAVGDAEFQRKCLGKMEEVSKTGRTILFVSHNLAAVENLCNHAMLLDSGRIVASGLVDDVIQQYQSSYYIHSGTRWERKILKDESAYFQSLELHLFGEQPALTLRLICTVVSQFDHKDAFLAIDVSNSSGVTIFQSIPEQEPFIKFKPLGQEIVCDVELPPLIPDQYKVSVWIGPHYMETLCWEREIAAFEISSSPTKGRNFPHSHHHGFLVPTSRIIR